MTGLLLALALASDKGLMPAWIEKDAAQYAGEYVCLEPDAQDPYRYTVSRIVLKQTEKGWAATYTSGVQKNGEDVSKMSADLKDVKVDGHAFSAAPVPVRKGWPGFLPPDGFLGFFAIEYPPGNAKGAVHRGLELSPSRKFFKRLGD